MTVKTRTSGTWELHIPMNHFFREPTLNKKSIDIAALLKGKLGEVCLKKLPIGTNEAMALGYTNQTLKNNPQPQ